MTRPGPPSSLARPASRRSRRRGITTVYAIIMLMALVGFVSLGVDFGRVQLAKTQLQQAADSAARAAAASLPGGITATQNAAVLWGGYNTADGTAVVVDPTNDVDFLTWTASSRTYFVLSGAARANANAVRVWGRRTNARGTGINLAFGVVIGKSTCDANTSSIAYAVTPNWPFLGLNGVTLQTGTVTTDAYDASVATYSTAKAINAGYLASNGNVTLSGGTVTVKSDVYMKAGGTLSTSGTVSYGTRRSLPSSVVWPTPTAGTYATSNNNGSVGLPTTGANATFSSGSATVPAGTYYLDSITINGGNLTMTAPTVIYMNGAINITSGSFSVSSNRPGGVIIYQTTSASISISGVTSFTADVQAPASAVSISGVPNVYGRFVGSTLTVTGTTALHGDVSLPNGSGATNPAGVVLPTITVVR